MDDFQMVIDRVQLLREKLFDAIDECLKLDGHCKWYEGRISLVFPHRFDDEYKIVLDCYLIGPSRGHQWLGLSFSECLDKAEKDIGVWIDEALSEN